MRAGMDLGGTKIELQLFDDAWAVVDRKRVATPDSYADLLRAIADLTRWADHLAGDHVALGIGAAGLLNPLTGRMLAANLAASGQPLKTDVETALGRPITLINDCRALALSEAVFGAGRGLGCVAAVILGTGVGGGVAIGGALPSGPTLTGGEFGHIAAPAHLVQTYGLPILPCGCGRQGCLESFVSGPGLQRLARSIAGVDLDPPAIAARKGADMAPVWAVWCELAAELLHHVTIALDPDVIVLGGGLSRIEGLVDDLNTCAARAQIGDFPPAPLKLAQGGETSGARGAAYAAFIAGAADQGRADQGGADRGGAGT